MPVFPDHNLDANDGLSGVEIELSVDQNESQNASSTQPESPAETPRLGARPGGGTIHGNDLSQVIFLPLLFDGTEIQSGHCSLCRSHKLIMEPTWTT